MSEQQRSTRPDTGLRLGLDIGGTKTEGVAIDAAGVVRARVRIPTRPGAVGVIATAEEAVAALRNGLDEAPRSLGAGIPGAVDARTGRVSHAVNLGIADLDLAEALTARLGLDTRVANDATAAAWGAFRTLRAERADLESLALLNLGTGLAAGLVLSARPWAGARGGAGEVGHLAVDPHGEECPCGQRGCLETIASGSGIARRWGGSASALVASARDGDPDAQRIWEDLVDAIAAAVRVLVQTLDVELVALAGGVGEATGEALLPGVRQRLARHSSASAYLASLDLPARVELLDTGLPVAAVGAALLAAD